MPFQQPLARNDDDVVEIGSSFEKGEEDEDNSMAVMIRATMTTISDTSALRQRLSVHIQNCASAMRAILRKSKA